MRDAAVRSAKGAGGDGPSVGSPRAAENGEYGPPAYARVELGTHPPTPIGRYEEWQ